MIVKGELKISVYYLMCKCIDVFVPNNVTDISYVIQINSIYIIGLILYAMHGIIFQWF